MSQSAAIAAVTLALRMRFEEALRARAAGERCLADVLVTTLPVDRARTVHHRCQLNLTLATVAESASMRNTMGLGGRGGAGVSTPAQLVDLLYLITAYGPDDDEVGAQRVMGAALRAVHEQPVLPSLSIAELLPGAGVSGTLDQLRVTQAPLAREQIVAWWLAFHTPYRLSVALQVTGVSLTGMPTPER
ncbi:DUF4255 domain-containing protein [Luteitalea sp. TBR-22]|uniref:DUF4255 domain-containing protein n=1 Tax=Luteitalea sp. TBR-22 TaxID=2802971 RepID=UPI001EF664F3|nr:DUF4255 domain-containing protein [Luteitalea sp. TBR-22]